MIELHIDNRARLVTLEGAILPATERPELAAGIEFYDIELVPVAGVAAGTYTLSGDIEFRRVNTMFQATATVETGEPLRFRVSTDTAGFWGKMRCRQPGTVLYIRCTAATADGDAVSVLEDRIYARPGVAGSGDVPAPNPGAVMDINGLSGAVVIKSAAGEALPAENGVITLPEIAPGTSVNGLTGAVVLTDENGTQLTAEGQNIPIPGANCVGDAELSGDNAFTGANSFAQPLTVGGRTVSGLYPDRNPVAQIPVLDATLGVCHYLDATLTEISFAYPVWHLVEIRALVRSVNAAITGTVEITPYIDDVAQTPVTINVGATWAAIVIPLAVETGSIRLVRTGGTLADGSWVTAAFRSITAMVTI